MQHNANSATLEWALQPAHFMMLPAGTTDDMLIDLWIEKQRSPATREAYRQDIRLFRVFLDYKPLRALTAFDMHEYEQWLQQATYVGKDKREHPYSHDTITRKLAAVKSLLSYAERMGYVPFNVGAEIRLESSGAGLAQRIMSEEDTIRLISLEPDMRNHAMLRLLYHCGLRVSELTGLQWGALIARKQGGQVTVVGKRNKERTIMINVSMWQELMALKAKSTSPYVFASQKGHGALSREQVLRIVKAAAKRAGLNTAVSPHWLRHAHASHSLERGATLALVKETLGHESITTTGRYTHARPSESSSLHLAM